MSQAPAADLTPAETEELQRDLVALQAALSGVLSGSADAARPVDLDEPIGRLSRMDAMQQQKLSQASHAGLVLREQQVRAALGRIADGAYGACLSCEEPIGFARLKARPETPFCIACQARRERR